MHKFTYISNLLVLGASLSIVSCGQKPEPVFPLSIDIDESQKLNFFFDTKNIASFNFELNNFGGNEIINAKITNQKKDGIDGKYVKFANMSPDEEKWLHINEGQIETLIDLEKIDNNSNYNETSVITLDLELTVISGESVVLNYVCDNIQILLARPTERSYFTIRTTTEGDKILDGFNSNYKDEIDLCNILLIDDDITIISDNAFFRNGETTIPAKMKWLLFKKNGESSFLQKIGAFAFKNSPLSGKLSLPNSLTEIGEGAFENCSNITGDLIFSPNIVKIGSFAFNNCVGLDGILTLPSNLEAINDFTFNNCENLECQLILPNKINKIGTNAFNNCSKLYGDLFIPCNVISIGNYAFCNCENLISLIFEEDVEQEKISQLSYIGNYAFYNCSKMTGNLIFPKKLNCIGDYAFSWCTFTGSLIFPSSVETIGNYAFEKCSNFNDRLVFGSNIKNIGDGAFISCDKFWLVDFSLTNCAAPSWLFRSDNQIFFGFNHSGGVFCPPIKGVQDEWEESISLNCSLPSTWKIIMGYNDTLESVFEITDNGITGFKSDVNISSYNRLNMNRLNNIQDNAFANNFPSLHANILCLNLQAERIGNNAFYNDYGLFGLLDLKFAQFIGSKAFANCKNLSLITNIEDIETIGDSAFENCEAMRGTLKIRAEFDGIGSHAFKNCKSIEVIDLSYYLDKIPTWINEEGNCVFEGLSENGGTVLIQASNIREWEQALKGPNCMLPSSWTIKNI